MSDKTDPQPARREATLGATMNREEHGNVKRVISAIALLVLLGCASENYANGERVGLVTQFSRAGIFWKSWEGHLNMTQTGMNSSLPFDFSIDNDAEDPKVVATIDSAARLGWKVKLVYHETFNKNWWKNRGETDHFVTTVDVLDRDPVAFMHSGAQQQPESRGGRTVDTIYVVITGRASEH